MKREQEPTRLEHTDDPAVRHAIGAARRELPDAERMQRLSLGLAAKLAGPGTGGGSDGGASTAAGMTSGAKVTAIVTAVVLAGGVGYFAHTSTEKAPTVRAMETSSAVMTPPSAAVAEPDPIPTLSIDELVPLAPSARLAAKPAPSASVSDTPTESDLGLLRRAQSTLGSDPAGALALCASHERTYPRSPYAQEREVLTIEALIRLGRRGEAEARADRFARAFPKSGHNRRIDSLLGR